MRPMQPADLTLVAAWLIEPHVSRWYLAGSSVDAELADLRESLAVDSATEVLMVVEESRLVGWCQWYPCSAYPDHADGVSAAPGDVGIDYALGEPAAIGRGLGTQLIASLLDHVWLRHPAAGVIADPAAANFRSRRVLEKNAFVLQDVRAVWSEPSDEPMAIYRRVPG